MEATIVKFFNQVHLFNYFFSQPKYIGKYSLKHLSSSIIISWSKGPTLIISLNLVTFLTTNKIHSKLQVETTYDVSLLCSKFPENQVSPWGKKYLSIYLLTLFYVDQKIATKQLNILIKIDSISPPPPLPTFTLNSGKTMQQDYTHLNFSLVH